MSIDWVALSRTFGLFAVNAIAELVGCYLPLLGAGVIALGHKAA